MDILSLIVDSVLAILALIIAIIQLLGEKRARKEDRRKIPDGIWLWKIYK